MDSSKNTLERFLGYVDFCERRGWKTPQSPIFESYKNPVDGAGHKKYRVVVSEWLANRDECSFPIEIVDDNGAVVNIVHISYDVTKDNGHSKDRYKF